MMVIDRCEIEIEDEEGLFDGAGVVPFYMKEEKEGSEGVLYLEVYSGIEDIAQEFADKFEGNYFSDKALSYLNSKIVPYLNGKGYYPERGSLKRYYHSFAADDVNDLDLSSIREDTFILDEKMAKELKSLVTFDLCELCKSSLFAAVTVKDGCVISIAAVNEYDDDQKMLEITTETAKDHRGCGYATSNCAALAKYIIEKGYLVAYCTSRYNKGSIKIAKKCGFTHTGRFFAIAGYKN